MSWRGTDALDMERPMAMVAGTGSGSSTGEYCNQWLRQHGAHIL